MARIKKVHGEAFKAKVALQSVRGDLTANQIGSRYGYHPTLVNCWRKELIAGAGTIFTARTRARLAPGRQQTTTSWSPNCSSKSAN